MYISDLESKGLVSDGYALYNEVLLIIYQNISTSKYDSNKGTFDAYYWRIAKWRWIDKLRKRSNETSIVSESFSNQAVELADFEDELTKLHMAEILKHCIEQLNAAPAEILQLYYFQNLNIKEVAAKVGKEIEAVKQSLHRSRNRLKLCLENKTKMESRTNSPSN